MRILLASLGLVLLLGCATASKPIGTVAQVNDPSRKPAQEELYPVYTFEYSKAVVEKLMELRCSKWGEKVSQIEEINKIVDLLTSTASAKMNCYRSRSKISEFDIFGASANIRQTSGSLVLCTAAGAKKDFGVEGDGSVIRTLRASVLFADFGKDQALVFPKASDAVLDMGLEYAQ